MMYKIYQLLIMRPAGCRVLIPLLATIILSSCSKDKQFDADILSANNTANQIAYVLKGRAIRFNGEFYSSTKDYVKVALKLNGQATNTDTIFTTINPALVAAYNQKYAENNLAIPPNAFKPSGNGKFAVTAGAAQATDSLYVLLNDASLLKDKTVYLIPVEVRTKSGSEVKFSVVYFKMLITLGDLTANFLGGSYLYYKFPSYRYNSLQIDYDRILKTQIPTVIKLGVGLNTAFTYHDVDISAEYGGDSASVAYGNKLLVNSNPQPFPADTYTISTVSGNGVTVVKGKIVPADSILITLKNKEKFLSLTSYVLGVKVKRVTGSAYSVPPAANDSARAYIRIYTY